MRRMITFDEDNIRFTNRVVGIAYDGDRVLLHRAVADDFWALPGGRAELLEAAADTLRREMREELGTDVEVERLVWCEVNVLERMRIYPTFLRAGLKSLPTSTTHIVHTDSQ